MITIDNATIKKHNTFSFVTYKFENLDITIPKKELIDYLYNFYETILQTDILRKENLFKQESVDRKNIEDQLITFYGNIEKREGFESVYKSKGNIQDGKFIGECSFFYIFEQTIKENFHLYFNVKNCSSKIYKRDSSVLIIDEIVVYMANFYGENEKVYEQLFNQVLSIIDNFIKEK